MTPHASAAEQRAPVSAYVVSLSSARDVRGVGAKAFNLARMIALGVPVPPGMVVTRAAFRAFLDENHLVEPIEKHCADLDAGAPERIRSAARSIRRLVSRASLPACLGAELESMRRELMPPGPLIVRSSAVGEDSASASFAGQLDSFPGIVSREQLESALRACWASYWSERALFYQLSRGTRLDGMGVVIQQQVHSRTSGVLFTEAPCDDGDVMLAEFCSGSGEALVSGRVTPSRLTISRRDLHWTQDPSAEGRLDHARILELARTGLRLERELGGPQDIEWTIDGRQRLYLVQSRPITTRRASSAPKVIWSNVNVNENFPEPISPFLYSIASTGYYHYFRNLARAFGISPRRIREMERPLRGIIGVHCGRMYYNLTNLHAVLRMAPGGKILAEFFNQFVGADLEPSLPREARAWDDEKRGRLARLAELGVIVAKTVWQYAFLSRRVAVFERTVSEFSERTHPGNLGRRTLPDLLENLNDFLDIRNNRWTGAALADTSSMVCHGLLKRFLRRAFPSPSRGALHNTLLKGLPDLISAAPAAELWKLSRHVRSDSELVGLFTDCAGREILERVRTDHRFDEFRQQLDEFVEQWGFRFSGELMLTIPSYQEDPAALLELLKSYVVVEGESPTDVMRRQAHDRERQTQGVLSELRYRKPLRFVPFWLQSFLVGRLLSWTHRSIALRERARLKQALLYSRCRRIALAVGGKLVQAGLLERSDDVFQLTVGELDRLATGRAMFPYDVKELVKLRRARHARCRSMNPRETLELRQGEYLKHDASSDHATSCGEEQGTARELAGVGACGGRVSARAAPVRDLTESHLLSPGEVLVTCQTDPGWGPLFFLAGGLILERGGMLSHGAILAREYGIPCVVSVAGATERIGRGRTVTVDGDLGIVRLGD